MIRWNARRACLCLLGAGWLLPWVAAAEERPPVQVIAWQDARDYLGREVEVVGKVVRTHKSSPGNVFFNFADDRKGTLEVYIPKAVVSQFPQAPDQLYQGNMVRIRGWVKDYRGSPSLTVTKPGDVTVLPDDAPLPARSRQIHQPAGAKPPRAGPQATTKAAGPEPILRPEEYLPTVPWNKAEDFIDQEVFVVGKVVRARQSSDGAVFLNFSGDFQNALSVYIRSQSVGRFPESPDKLYLNKLVKIHGRIVLFKGKPSLTLYDPKWVTILPDAAVIPTEPVLPARVKPPMSAAAGPEITIATCNVMNLFDEYDDPYSDDTADVAKPRDQLIALAKFIRSLDADVLLLAEVRNRGVLETFVRVFLADMGYGVVLVEGNDSRGIDVAVLSRLPVGPVTTHRHLQFADSKGHLAGLRRDLLEVRIEPPGGAALDVFAVHLKSRGGQEAGSLDIRLAEAREVRAILDGHLICDPNAPFLVCGAFSDTLDSEPVKVIIGSGPGQLTNFANDVPADERVTFNQEPFRSMIGFVLASPAMAKRYVARSYRILPGSPEAAGPDHNAVIARFLTRP